MGSLLEGASCRLVFWKVCNARKTIMGEENIKMRGAVKSASRPGRYILECRADGDGSPAFIAVNVVLRSGEVRQLRLPLLPRLRYLIAVEEAPVTIAADQTQGVSLSLHPVGILDTRLLLFARDIDSKLTLSIDGEVTFAPLVRAEGYSGRQLRKALKLIGDWGFGLSTDNLQKTPELFDAVPPLPDDPWHIATPEGPRIAIVLHLHYRELWPEFECLLRRQRRNFRLLVTLTQEDKSLTDRIRHVFPNSEVFVMRNRGRDVGPFLNLVAEGKLEGYDLICKVHGKKSGLTGPRALLGEVWRRATMLDLLGSAEQVESILSRFAADPHVGMIGPAPFRLPNKFILPLAAWGENQAKTLELAELLGLSPSTFQLDFFAGTMFWMRGSLIEPMRQLGFSQDDFDAEDHRLDGALHHAFERLFGALPASRGMVLESATSYSRDVQPARAVSGT